MDRKILPLALGLLAVGMGGAVAPVYAQNAAADFPDVPGNHWAYDAVNKLAERGYVKGDPDGKFYGKRTMTRYEFATVIARMLQTIDELSAKANANVQNPPPAPITPSGDAVTMDDLKKVQDLVETFRAQLEAIGTPIAPVQDQIEALQADIKDAKALAVDAKNRADSSYAFGSKRDFVISGYIQARFQSADSGDRALFPQGLGDNTGATASFNGNYDIGGTKETFAARRARLKLTGKVSTNTRYALQIDAGGFTTNNTAPNNVTVREANVVYIFGKTGNPDKNLAITAGLLANYFGFELPTSSRDIISPERPLAFNEGGNGLFINQDYDRGVHLSWNAIRGDHSGLRVIAGAVNGTGLNGITGGGINNGATVGGGGNDNNNRFDQIYRIAGQNADNSNGVGVSYYNGTIPRPGIIPGSNPPVGYTGPNYQEAKKELYGVDAHYTTPFGLALFSEYVGGKYELRSFFTSTSSAKNNQFAPGNKVEGYYFQGTYDLAKKTRVPLTLAVSYDVFKRSKSGVDATAQDGGGASGSAFTDENVGYGVLYNLDKQTRLRVWYTKPNKVAHASNVADPKNIGLFTTELQVKF